jgi:hypothetical protein
MCNLLLPVRMYGLLYSFHLAWCKKLFKWGVHVRVVVYLQVSGLQVKCLLF